MKIHKIVKTLFKVYLLTSLCLIFTGCTLTENLLFYAESIVTGEPYTSKEARLYNEAVDNFFVALDAGDKDALHEMFSPSVQATDSDLDIQIDRLMEAYPGPTDVCGRDGSMVAGSYSNSHGKHTSSVGSRFAVASNGKYFFCLFDLMYENDVDEDQIGITRINFYSDNDYCAEMYSEDTDISTDNGLSIYMHYPLDCEIRVINSFPYKYAPTAKALNESEVKAFLQSSSCYSQFVDRFGEPNAADIFYYWELTSENDTPYYLELGIDEQTDSIYGATVVDNFDWLYSLLPKDDE